LADEHVPVDHKDDSAEYRRQVWEAVSQRVGSPLTPLPTGTTFEGKWDVESETFGTRSPILHYEFVSASRMTVALVRGDDTTPREEFYEVGRGGRMSVAGETYHAATTDAGALVLFNGDSSLVLVATRR